MNKPWASPKELSSHAGAFAPSQLEMLGQNLRRASPTLRVEVPPQEMGNARPNALLKYKERRRAWPSTLAEYKFEACLGEGAYGEVFRARRDLTGEVCAVKRSRRDASGCAVQAFEDEVRALGRLDHPGVVALIEHFSDGDNDYLVEELCGGVCLLDFIAESEAELDGVPYVPEGASIDILRQCLAAVAHCHAEGFAHRDLKPENFVVDEDGSVKLVDFGLACPPSPTSGKHRGGLLGSVPYMAPEMVTEDSHSVAVDVWSLGVVFFTLLTGEFLLPDEGDRAQRCLMDPTFVERRFAKCKSLSKIGVSGEAMDVLRRMLAHDPAKRITAAEALSHPLFASACLE